MPGWFRDTHPHGPASSPGSPIPTMPWRSRPSPRFEMVRRRSGLIGLVRLRHAVQALLLVVLRQAQMAPDGIIHGNEKAVGAPQKVEATEIGLDEGGREFEIDPPGG